MALTSKQKTYVKYGLGASALAAILYFILKDNGSGGATEDPTGNGTVTNPNQPAGFNAKKIADALYEVMIPTGYASWISGNGDEKEIIFNLLRNVSASQFVQVMAAFNKKPYNPTWGNNYFALWSDPTKYTLPFILSKELTPQDYNVLRQKYPNSL